MSQRDPDPPSARAPRALKVAVTIDTGEGASFEWVWVSRRGASLVVDNIPLFAYGLSPGDGVAVEVVDGAPTLRAVVSRGGHSTYRVAFDAALTPMERQRALEPLHRAGCGFEYGPSRMVAIDVPPASDVFAIYGLLEEGMSRGWWTFEEGHYGHPGIRGSSPVRRSEG